MQYANMVVYEKSKESKELEGMGTTLEICLIYNNKVFIGHVGDSRIYRIRKEFMRKLTQDHSYVQKLVKDGTITQDEAVSLPRLADGEYRVYAPDGTFLALSRARGGTLTTVRSFFEADQSPARHP